MDWVLFNKYCDSPQLFLDKLQQGEGGSFSAEKILFTIQIFVEVTRSMCPKLSRSQLSLRQLLWKANFGVPTLDFLLFNQTLIQQVKISVLDEPKADLSDLFSSRFKQYRNLLQKNDRAFLYETYHTPAVDQSALFVPTMNHQGFMTTRAIDAFSKAFINAAKQSALEGGQVLEIGAAYGVTSLEALRHGATVFCNDLEPAHLAIVKKDHLQFGKGHLIAIPGAFPDEFIFKPQSFDAIFISRVLHFFSGEEVIKALQTARTWLKPQGRLFLVNETPFLSNWHAFLGEYERRKKSGERWPGLINDPSEYEKGTTYLASLPDKIHFFDKETLERALLEAGFKKEGFHVEYMNRAGQFPPAILMPEKQQESVGCSAIKLE
ncbi:MAG: class I SAM-dependent methyltransferase [Legionellaceae bacterium]|nr:class I SAM-dependent methyltransferase [Legionellaceae bacterium]